VIDLLEAYLERLALKGASEHTVRAYRGDLLAASRALKEHDASAPGAALSRATPEQLQAWIAALKRKGSSAPTIHRKLAALHGFYRFAVKTRAIAFDPSDDLEAPKIAERLPRHLSPGEVRQLRQVLEVASTPLELADAAAVGTLYFTGLRASELLGLQLARVDLEVGELRVVGKGNRERMVPVPRELAALIRRWLAVRPPGPGTLMGRAGQPMTYKQLTASFKRVMRLAGLADRYTPHKLRHTFATRLLAKRVDITKIQRLLGHKNINTTTIYAHADVGRELRRQLDDAL
jgi:site-specific recombinase XerD